MKILSRICLTVFLIFIASSCDQQDKKQPASKINPQDSIAMSTVFQQALLPTANEDSLKNIANGLLKKDPNLKDIHQYNSLRNDIMKGRLDQAGEELEKIYLEYEKDSVNYKWAKYLNLLASVSAYKNKQNDAVTYFRKALVLCENNNDKLQTAAIRYNLANIFLSRTDYKTAHDYAIEAHSLLEEIKDVQYLPIVKGLLAVTTLHTSKDLQVAEKFADGSLELSEQHKNLQGFMLAYYAKGEILAKQDKFQEAIEPLQKALNLGEQYRQTQITLSAGAALVTCYLGLKEYETAIKFGLKTLDLAQEAGVSDIEYSVNKNLGKSYAAMGDHKNAFHFIEKAEQQYREKSNTENEKVIQNLLISYETEKKNNTILMQENKLQEKSIWIIALAALSALILGILFFMQKLAANKQKMLTAEKEKEVLQALTEGEEMERSRLSGELHDGVGSQLTAIKLNLENMDDLQKLDQQLKLIKEVHREVRMVAHNLMPVDFESNTLAVGLKEFCERSSNESLPIQYFSNAYDFAIPKYKAHGLYRAVQELVQNAIKHAKAEQIFVQCLLGEDELHLSIEDNGIGMDISEDRSGEDFRFLKQRMAKMEADFEVISTKGNGTLAKIILKL